MHLLAKLSLCYLLVSPVSYSLSLSNSKMSTSSLPVVERLLERLMLSFARVMAKRSPRLHSIGSSRIAAERERGRQKHRERQSEENITRAFHNFRGYGSIQHARCSGQFIYWSYANKVLYIWARWWNLTAETTQFRKLYYIIIHLRENLENLLTDSFSHTVILSVTLHAAPRAFQSTSIFSTLTCKHGRLKSWHHNLLQKKYNDAKKKMCFKDEEICWLWWEWMLNWLLNIIIINNIAYVEQQWQCISKFFINLVSVIHMFIALS